MTKVKHVRFSETSQMVLVANQTEGIESNLWYSRNDIGRFKFVRAYSTVNLNLTKQISNHAISLLDGEMLGMEKYLSKELTYEYRHRRKNRMKAVLKEQRLQRLNRVSSSGRISKIARNYSKWAGQHALAAALLLEHEQEQKNCMHPHQDSTH